MQNQAFLDLTETRAHPWEVYSASEMSLHLYFYVFIIIPCPNPAQRQNSTVLAEGKKITC